MTFKDGDFLEIEYSMWDASEGRLIATTDEQKAKSGSVYDDEAHYGPALVVLGSNSVIKGLDKALHSMAVNEQKKFTLKPDEAFGIRDEELVRVMPMSEFRKHEINPYPGMRVNIDNVQAIVKSVNSGRVVVDANPPYASREVTYEVKVVSELASDKDRISALGRSYGVSPTKVEINEKTATISFGADVNKNADYFVGKASMCAAIFSYLKGIDKVKIDEEYDRPKEKAPEIVKAKQD